MRRYGMVLLLHRLILFSLCQAAHRMPTDRYNLFYSYLTNLYKSPAKSHIPIIFPTFATEMKALTDTQYIRQLVSEGEHCHQDFKFEISDARKIARSLSAFANTEGGRLLVGVKDNGKIAGVRSEEEIYMIEAAATMYCRPEVELETRTYSVEGKTVLEVSISETGSKPVYALDEENKPWAYIRIKDENILATPVHLKVWQHAMKTEGVLVEFTEKEQRLIDTLKEKEEISLNQCCKLCHLNRKTACELLADFIRFGLVEPVFTGHKFYFKLNKE